MSEENNNSNNDLSREEINEQLDKVKKNDVHQASLLKRAGVVTCYRTSQPDEPDQQDESSQQDDPFQQDKSEVLCYAMPSHSGERRGKKSGRKKRSCWGCLIGTLAAIGGLFLFWRTSCKPPENDHPVMMCYCPAPEVRIEEEIKSMSSEIDLPDDNDNYVEQLREQQRQEWERRYKEQEQEQEQPVNNADNAETNDKPTE